MILNEETNDIIELFAGHISEEQRSNQIKGQGQAKKPQTWCQQDEETGEA